MNKKSVFVVVLATTALLVSSCKGIDYASTSVPGENATFKKITEEDQETLVPPAFNYQVGSKGYARNIIEWRLAQRFDISRDNNVAYLAIRDGYKNIFVKNLMNLGSSNQRTNRVAVDDISYSPDGNNICFSERNSDGTSYLYIINAKQGSFIQQISPSNTYDCQPHYTKDGKHILFARYVNGSPAIWSYEIATGNFSMLCNGSNPCPINNKEFVYSKKNQWGYSEIWVRNYVDNTDNLVKRENGRSFTTGSVSPDGKWLLFVSTSGSDTKVKDNLDIYYMRSDGSGGATQITFHEGNDCSPVWSPDGKLIYFLSQRGTKHGEYNIWVVNFAEQENLIDNQYEYTPQQDEQQNSQQNQGGIKLPKRRQR